MDLLSMLNPLGGMVQQAQQPQSSFMPAQQQPESGNRFLSDPAFRDALLRFGAGTLQANAQGAGFGGSVGAGLQGASEAIQQARENQMKQALIQAQVDKAKREAAYGVRSGGFEGDIARAQVVLNNPNATDEDKRTAQAVIQTAQRYMGGYDPVNNEYTYHPRTIIGGNAQQSPMGQSAAMPSQMPVPSGTLLPPPSGNGAPDMSMFQGVPSTGNRKVDAALMQKAKELELETGAKQSQSENAIQTEGKANLATAVDNANYALSVIDKALTSPGLESSVGGIGGIKGRLAQAFPITEGQRQFAPLMEQIKGSNFLQAYQLLRGGGAITNVEGGKAEAAMARLQQYQDPETFKKAIMDLRDVISTGIQRAKGKATMGANAQPVTQTPVKPSGKSDADILKELGL